MKVIIPAYPTENSTLINLDEVEEYIDTKFDKLINQLETLNHTLETLTRILNERT